MAPDHDDSTHTRRRSFDRGATGAYRNTLPLIVVSTLNPVLTVVIFAMFGGVLWFKQARLCLAF
jgi:hypothetical protein